MGGSTGLRVVHDSNEAASFEAFRADIQDMVARSLKASKRAETEEATKLQVINPFLRALGFDPADPDHVIAEFTADVGIKKNEKVDYALKSGDEVDILLEAKSIQFSLGDGHISQLYRYFAASNAKLAILTNGKEFRFYTDTNTLNQMDTEPFFVFNTFSCSEEDIGLMRLFHRDVFDPAKVSSAASYRRYQRQLMDYMKRQAVAPDDEFTRFIGKVLGYKKRGRDKYGTLKPLVQTTLDKLFANGTGGDDRVLQEDPAPTPAAVKTRAVPASVAGDVIFHIISERKGIHASARLGDGKSMIVLAGSRASRERGLDHGNTAQIRQELIADGILQQDAEGYVFVKDHLFRSPAAAANIVMAAKNKARELWKTPEGLTYGEWHARGRG